MYGRVPKEKVVDVLVLVLSVLVRFFVPALALLVLPHFLSPPPPGLL